MAHTNLAMIYCVSALFLLAGLILSFLSAPASYALSIANITPRPPTFTDVNGNKITTTEAGRQIMVSQTYRNEIENQMVFVGLFEVRDEIGITVFLGWQTGEIPASNYDQNIYNNNTMSFSWLPEKASTYEARTFAISDLENPLILSQVETATIVVT